MSWPTCTARRTPSRSLAPVGKSASSPSSLLVRHPSHCIQQPVITPGATIITLHTTALGVCGSVTDTFVHSTWLSDALTSSRLTWQWDPQAWSSTLVCLMQGADQDHEKSSL